MNFVHLFAQELQRPHPQPELLAFAIAGHAYPDLDPAAYLRQLDDLAATVQLSLRAPAGRRRAEEFLYCFNTELGFTGNRDDYYDPANSFLNAVLTRRTGLPITLSLLCVALGKRIGLDIVGMGFPGHFMARYQDESGAWLLDPFNGEVVEVTDANAYLSTLFERPIYIPTELYVAVTAQEIAHRILNNLRNVYLRRNEYARALQVVDYLLELTPVDPLLWQERGLLHYYRDELEPAAYALKRYFFLRGHLMLAWDHKNEDNSPPAGAPGPGLDADDRQVLEIFNQIEAMRLRLN